MGLLPISRSAQTCAASSPHLEHGVRAGGGGVGVCGVLRPVFVAVGQHLQELLCRFGLEENTERQGSAGWAPPTQAPRQPDIKQWQRLR